MTLFMVRAKISGMQILGLDIGGTKIEAAVIDVDPRGHGDFEFEVGARLRTPTPRQQGYSAIEEAIINVTRDVLKEAGTKPAKIKTVGAGLPGTVSPHTGRMTFGNTNALAGKSIPAIMKKALGKAVPVATENDANCFALAEALCGAGIKHAKSTRGDVHHQSSVGIILGTGVGGGLIHHGHIEGGRQGGAGEIGHTELYTGGHSCYCGRNGCAETYLSGTGFEAHFASRMYAQISERPDARGIFELARNGDPVAMGVVLQYKKDLAKFLGNLVNILDPDYFVLGGGMSNADEIYEGLEAAVQAHCFLPKAAPKVYRNRLGDSAGVIGAALIAI